MTSNEITLQSIERPMQQLDAATLDGAQGGLTIRLVCFYVPVIKRGWLGIPYVTLVRKCLFKVVIN